MSNSTQLTLKLIAFGPKGYFQSWRNIFDVLLALYSIVYIVFAVVLLSLGLKVENNTTYLEAVCDDQMLSIMHVCHLLSAHSNGTNPCSTQSNHCIDQICKPFITITTIT